MGVLVGFWYWLFIFFVVISFLPGFAILASSPSVRLLSLFFLTTCHGLQWMDKAIRCSVQSLVFPHTRTICLHPAASFYHRQRLLLYPSPSNVVCQPFVAEKKISIKIHMPVLSASSSLHVSTPRRGRWRKCLFNILYCGHWLEAKK